MREDGVDLRQDEGQWLTKTNILDFIPPCLSFCSPEMFFLQNVTSMFDTSSSLFVESFYTDTLICWSFIELTSEIRNVWP